jgi:general secretion pathway protein L
MEKSALERWDESLREAGFDHAEIHTELLLLPRAAGEWSLAWDGREGFVRTDDYEGASTDRGSRGAPPLSLRLLADGARKAGTLPATIAVYALAKDSEPDFEAWHRELLVPLRSAGQWNWSAAAPTDGFNLSRPREGWRMSGDLAARLRPAAWIAAGALALHAIALTVDWTVLRSEQRNLRQQMESRFRAAVPDAVAVADPALQMRRKLADARHAAGVSDAGDFLPMMEKTAAALKELPAGSLRVASYEQGRLSLELTGIDEPAARRFILRLLQSGANLDASLAPVRSGNGAYVVTVNPS